MYWRILPALRQGVNCRLPRISRSALKRCYLATDYFLRTLWVARSNQLLLPQCLKSLKPGFYNACYSMRLHGIFQSTAERIIAFDQFLGKHQHG